MTTETDRRTLMLGGAAALAGTLALPAAAVAQAAPFTLDMRAANGRYVRHRPRVAVASYGVSYLYSSRTSASGGWGAQARIDTVLDGVSPELMAEVSEAACIDLRERLAAAGETVASVDETRQALTAANVPFAADNRRQGDGTLDGRTTKRWLAVGSTSAPMIEGSSGETNAMLGGIQARNRLAPASVALDAIMVNPILWLDYVRMESSGRRVFGNSASVSGAPSVGVLAAQSSFIVSAGDARGRLVMATLNLRGDVWSDARFAEVIEGQAPVSLASILGSAGAHLVRADPTAWRALATAAYQGYNTAVTAAVRSIRA